MIDDESLKNLEKLHQLKADGIISEEDFEKSKERILYGQKILRMPTMEAGKAAIAIRDDWYGWAMLPLKRYADFNGRSGRKEFWAFLLVYLALTIVSVLLAGMVPTLGAIVFLLGLVVLFIPQLALQVRRFHDQDKSGWFALMNLIPYVGVVIVLIFMLLQGTRGENRFGPDPREA